MAGRDAALDAILEAPSKSSFTVPWQGTLALADRDIEVRVDSLFPTDGSHGSMTSES